MTELHDLFDRHWRHLMAEHPELATMTGWPEGHDRWTDMSVEAIERRRRESGRWLAEAEAIDPTGLGEVDRRSLEMFLAVERSAVEAARFPAAYLALNQMEGPHLDPSFYLGIMGKDSPAELADVVLRLDAIPELVDQTIEVLRRGIELGVTQPAICLREVPAQIELLLSDDPATNPLLLAFADAPDDVRAKATGIVADRCVPAYHRLHQMVTGTYLPACRETTALGDLPEGRDWYAERVRYHTTTDLSVEEIHEIGQAEVRRIVAEMDEVMAETGFTGDRKAFAEHLRTDPMHYFSSEAELLGFYRDIAKRADPGIVRLFSRLPRLPFGIVPVPADQAPSAPGAYYMPGSLELGRAGMFYANTYDLASRPRWNMEAICLHEAVPGHHFQIALAQETEGLPLFRAQSLTCTAYVEGWGLYCEGLGPEVGMYDDPYQRYGALDGELMRACRLVLDTGLHALGWSRQQAIDFFVEHSPSPEHDLIVEVDRYIVLPGQALAYKVGSLKIQELRERAAAAQGDQFDLRAFHDEVLRHGALPLGMLERVIDEWLAA
ncbi:MAG: hypothetical protein JWO68_1805 [Actinomycetia bacterium]|nr:hypothetical protein [Actinomycetes bacterium]